MTSPATGTAPRRRRGVPAARALVGVVGLVLTATVLTPPPASADGHRSGPTHATGPGLYVVTLQAPPAAVHRGTRPTADRRLDTSAPAVREHRRAVRAEQDRVLATVGDPVVRYRYDVALNGFAAVLDERQVKQLRSRDDVVLVERSTVSPTAQDTDSVLGMGGPDGAWAGTGGPTDAGRGTVVGLIDTGLWPENPGFAAVPGRDGFSADPAACTTGEQWARADCNDKIAAARWFVRGFGGPARLASSEYLSPRDAIGHGTHAASVVAGATGVRVSVEGQRFGVESGMAPGARLAVYKACWAAPDPADDGCATADVVAAVDAAVGDGVDVLAYGATGSGDPLDSVGRAFLGAATAGVLVTAPAGNDGPAAGSVGHLAPWVTTVAAGTHRLRQGAVRLGGDGGRALHGAMTSDRSVAATAAVRGVDAATPDTTRADAARCAAGSLDAAAVADRVVVCERGDVARVEKSTTVASAGGVAMVLVNVAADTVDADVHAVPTVHLDVEDGASLLAYLREQGEDAELSLDAAASEAVDVPTVAPFSARGPTGEDLLKPDLTAPGVGVLGAVSPPASGGRRWDLAAGTSVSTAHVAGLAAWLAGTHPRWSPSRLKSALMTTAEDVEGGAGLFAQGAGHVSPADATDPGLVLDQRPAAWLAYAEGRREARDLNLPSVAVTELVRRTTVTRRVTHVGATTETYDVTVDGLEGIEAAVRPRRLTLAPGESRRVRIALRAVPGASLTDHTRGRLRLTGLTHRLQLPMAVRVAAVAAPPRVTSRPDTREVVVRGRSGSGEPVEASATGLVPASPVGLTLEPGRFDPDSPEVDDDTFSTSVHVPPDTEAARFQVAGDSSGDDVDLYVFDGDRLVDAATGPGPGATVTLTTPETGTYTVYVHAAEAGNLSAATSQLSTWVVPREGGEEVVVDPETTPSSPGDTFRLRARWDQLDPTQRWLGVLRYADSETQTFIEVD